MDPEEEAQGEEMDPNTQCDSQSFEESNVENTAMYNTTAADSKSPKWCLHICSPVPNMKPSVLKVSDTMFSC